MIVLLDPGFRRNRKIYNRGDDIISRASLRELKALHEDDIVRLPTHEYLTLKDFLLIRKADRVYVGGSNLLWFRFFPSASWKLGLLLFCKDITLLGVGWGSYEIATNGWGRLVTRLILSKNYLHSTRDEYTKEKLKELGVENVVSTGCHTTWRTLNLSKQLSSLPREILVTLTDYRQNRESDSSFLNYAFAKFDKVHFWVQGSNDLDYIKSLGFEPEVLDIELEDLISFINEKKKILTYIGTRLHAGMLCYELGIPSAIIGVDNRAIELAKDLSINVIPRNYFELNSELDSIYLHQNLTIKHNEIDLWRSSQKV